MKNGTIENKQARTHTQTHTTDSIRAYIDSCLICRHMSQAIAFSWALVFPFFSELILTQCLICDGTLDSRLRERERHTHIHTRVCLCVCVSYVLARLRTMTHASERDTNTLIFSYVLARLTQVSDRDTQTECVQSQVKKIKKISYSLKIKKKIVDSFDSGLRQ